MAMLDVLFIAKVTTAKNLPEANLLPPFLQLLPIWSKSLPKKKSIRPYPLLL